MESTQQVISTGTASRAADKASALVKTVRGPLSFMTETRTARGRYVSSSCFDVPDEEYSAGWITGTEAAAQLLAAMKRGEQGLQVAEILAEAGMAARRLDGAEGPCKRGAALGFLQSIEEVLYGAAGAIRHEAYFAAKITEMRSTRETLAAQEQADKVAFVERMRAARAAKRGAETAHG